MAIANLTEEQRKTLKSAFKEIYRNSEDAKALTKSNGDLKETLAEQFKVSKQEISKAYTYWLFSQEKPDVWETATNIVDQLTILETTEE